MKNSRRDFIKRFSTAATLITIGGFQSVNAADLFGYKNEVKFRFIIGSDAHFGEPETPYEQMADIFINKANAFHKAAKCNFCVLNGDVNLNHAFLDARTQRCAGIIIPIGMTCIFLF